LLYNCRIRSRPAVVSVKKTAQVLFLLLLIGPAGANNWNNASPFAEMMRFMLSMFEAMRLYQEFSGHIGYSSAPFGYQHPPPYPAPPGGASLPPGQHKLLEGAWVSENHILLAIKRGYARMYWSREQYRNYYVKIQPEHLQLVDADTGQVQQFAYRLRDNRLALRDNQGRMIRFLRLAPNLPPPTGSSGNFWDPGVLHWN